MCMKSCKDLVKIYIKAYMAKVNEDIGDRRLQDEEHWGVVQLDKENYVDGE